MIAQACGGSPVRWLVLTAMIVLVLGGVGACRRGGGEGDADGDVDADGDADGDTDADGDADDEAGDAGDCAPAADGACDPIAHCGCQPGETCDVTLDDTGQAATEVCVEGEAGAGTHGEPCPCAEGFLCLDPGVCLKLCLDDSSICPERSYCDTSFMLSDQVSGAPYHVCSPQRPEAEANYGVCLAPAGQCPSAGAEERTLSSDDGATWSCTIDTSADDEIVLDFELTQGARGIRGTHLVFPVAPGRPVPATCESFSIIEGGDEYSPTECVRGIPTAGTCVISVDYSDGQVLGMINCLELSGGGSTLLSTINGTELGAGSFALRSCEVRQ